MNIQLTAKYLTLLIDPAVNLKPLAAIALIKADPHLRTIRINYGKIKRELKWLEKDNHHIITFADLNYPTLLKQISHPPILLFVRGDPTVLNKQQLAIVGSRKASV